MKPATLVHSIRLILLPVLATVFLAGCDVQKPPVVFEPNLVHTMKYQIQEDVPMDQASADSTWVVETMFGTPDEPKLPEVVTEDEELSAVVSMDRLMRASGPEDAEGRGLFRKHCVLCHGVTGNGRGRTAADQVPYPRDYRMGIFKFKSTPRGIKPTRDDLARLIRDGIAGTAMKKIPELSEEDIQSLVDYVIYLSMRGEHERRQIDMAIIDGIIQDGERVINSDFGRKYLSDPEFKQQAEASQDEEDKKTLDRFEEDWEYAEEYAVSIAESWLDADKKVLDVPDPPADLPLAESYADVLDFKTGDQAAKFEASVKMGQELFVGKIAACSKCHGNKGLGDGQTTDYDDWTKDWTARIGLKPEDREALTPLLARGALAPRNAVPRNFAEGVFRGGSSSKDLYRRIMQGIDGTPMPAATFVEGQFEQDEVWHIINFIRSLQTAEVELDAAEPAPTEASGLPAA